METYFNNLTSDEGGKKRLLHDIRHLIEEAEALIKTTADELPEKSKGELLERLERLKQSCQRVDQQAVTGLEMMDQVVRRRPYQCLGIAALGGLLMGIILNKR